MQPVYQFFRLLKVQHAEINCKQRTGCVPDETKRQKKKKKNYGTQKVKIMYRQKTELKSIYHSICSFMNKLTF